jgi:hypothetical protein
MIEPPASAVGWEPTSHDIGPRDLGRTPSGLHDTGRTTPATFEPA